MSVGLTRRQAECLRFIASTIRETGGLGPTFDEIGDHLGLASKSGVHRLITGLEERGFIRRLRKRARAFEVLQLPPSDDSLPIIEDIRILTDEAFKAVAQAVLAEGVRRSTRGAA